MSTILYYHIHYSTRMKQPCYSAAVFEGNEIKKKQVQKYVSRRKEPIKKYRRRSTFGVGLDGEQWINYLDRHSELVQ